MSKTQHEPRLLTADELSLIASWRRFDTDYDALSLTCKRRFAALLRAGRRDAVQRHMIARMPGIATICSLFKEAAQH